MGGVRGAEGTSAPQDGQLSGSNRLLYSAFFCSTVNRTEVWCSGGDGPTSCQRFSTFVAKGYGLRAAGMRFRVDIEEARTIACSSGVHQGDPNRAGDVLPGIADGAEAFPRRVRGRRSGDFR